MIRSRDSSIDDRLPQGVHLARGNCQYSWSSGRLICPDENKKNVLDSLDDADDYFL